MAWEELPKAEQAGKIAVKYPKNTQTAGERAFRGTTRVKSRKPYLLHPSRHPVRKAALRQC